jgi:hypothetical protein
MQRVIRLRITDVRSFRNDLRALEDTLGIADNARLPVPRERTQIEQIFSR